MAAEPKPKKTYRHGFVVTPKSEQFRTFNLRYCSGDFTFKPIKPKKEDVNESSG